MPRRMIETKRAEEPAPQPDDPFFTELSDEDQRELIALRAYELYLLRGTACGDEMSDWLTAELEVHKVLSEKPYLQTTAPRDLPKRRDKRRSKVTSSVPARHTRIPLSNRKSKSKSEAA